jgi:hypothetical protein
MPSVVLDRAFAQEQSLTGEMELSLGSVTCTITPVLANMSGVKTAFGDQIHVVIGRPFLDRFAMVIDAPDARLKVYQPTTPIPASASTQICDVSVDSGRAAIDVSLEGGPQLRAGVSYFNGTAVSLRETEAVRAWLSDGRPWSTAFAGSVGDPSAFAKVFSLKSLSIGKHTLADVPVMVESSANSRDTGPDVVLGPLLLNQFQITLPGRVRQIWFTPTPTTFNQKIRRSLTGIYAVPASEGLEVKHVGANSPASRTRLRPGDLIATINGAPAKRATIIGAVVGDVLDLVLTSGETLQVKATRYY